MRSYTVCQFFSNLKTITPALLTDDVFKFICKINQWNGDRGLSELGRLLDQINEINPALLTSTNLTSLFNLVEHNEYLAQPLSNFKSMLLKIHTLKCCDINDERFAFFVKNSSKMRYVVDSVEEACVVNPKFVPEELFQKIITINEARGLRYIIEFIFRNKNSLTLSAERLEMLMQNKIFLTSPIEELLKILSKKLPSLITDTVFETLLSQATNASILGFIFEGLNKTIPELITEELFWQLLNINSEIFMVSA